MKVAILTHYYKSINYGGALQAYALCKYLNSKGYDTEQLKYEFNYEPNDLKNKDKMTFASKISHVPNYLYKKIKNKKYIELIQKRRKVFSYFLDNYVKHSNEEYNFKNIINACQKYDCFITGSDQVWNFDWFDDNYFLSFTNKTKISYAASISKDTLSDKQIEYLSENLKKFKKISVRESSAISLLHQANIFNAVITIDPTLLISREEWEEVIPNRIIKDKYVFAYFLGTGKENRKFIKKYAKQKELKIVSISITNGAFRLADSNFSDIELEEVSPLDFLSLIKYSEFVFTDSFHATLFSGMFSKRFLVFKRDKRDTMSSRIIQILEHYNLSNRFCENTSHLSFVELERSISNDYDIYTEKLKIIINESKKFLEL